MIKQRRIIQPMRRVLHIVKQPGKGVRPLSQCQGTGPPFGILRQFQLLLQGMPPPIQNRCDVMRCQGPRLFLNMGNDLDIVEMGGQKPMQTLDFQWVRQQRSQLRRAENHVIGGGVGQFFFKQGLKFMRHGLLHQGAVHPAFVAQRGDIACLGASGIKPDMVPLRRPNALFL